MGRTKQPPKRANARGNHRRDTGTSAQYHLSRLKLAPSMREAPRYAPSNSLSGLPPLPPGTTPSRRRGPPQEAVVSPEGSDNARSRFRDPPIDDATAKRNRETILDNMKRARPGTPMPETRETRMRHNILDRLDPEMPHLEEVGNLPRLEDRERTYQVPHAVIQGPTRPTPSLYQQIQDAAHQVHGEAQTLLRQIERHRDTIQFVVDAAAAAEPELLPVAMAVQSINATVDREELEDGQDFPNRGAKRGKFPTLEEMQAVFNGEPTKTVRSSHDRSKRQVVPTGTFHDTIRDNGDGTLTLRREDNRTGTVQELTVRRQPDGSWIRIAGEVDRRRRRR